MAPVGTTSELDIDWLYVYIGSWFCLIALVVTRHAYKLSPGFRERLSATGFHKLEEDASQKEKASVMLAVLCDAWPSTVSEMLEDTEAAHGMVFKSLMITGCLIIMMCDFGKLSPNMPEMQRGVAFAIGVVHLLRRVIFATAVGFCFAPSSGHDHAVALVRSATVTSSSSMGSSCSERLSKVPLLKDMSVKALPADERAEIARTTIVGSVHVILACGMLTLLPVLEFLALSCEAFVCASYHISQALLLDPCGIAWCTIVLLRLLHIGAIQLCMSVFGYHFLAGFLSPARHHSFKGFWAEFTACRLFGQLMMLAAVQSWFARPEPFGDLPLALRFAALCSAALHGVICLHFCVVNAVLCLRNVEYSEAKLVAMFQRGRSQHAVVQVLLDAQLAFIGCIQSELGIHEKDDTQYRAPVRKWLLQQVQILVKFFAKHEIYPSSNFVKHMHAD